MSILSKYIFLIGLFLILLGGLFVFLNHQGFALRLLGLAFWIIVGGTLLYIMESKNER